MYDFLAATEIIAYTCVLLGQRYLDVALKMSIECICGVPYTMGSVHIDNFSEPLAGDKREIKIEKIRTQLSRVSGLNFPNVEFGAGGWQSNFGPHIWRWIHIVTIHLELTESLKERVSFLFFVEKIILCADCKKHYIDNFENLKNTVINNTAGLTDTFLAMHTLINRNRQGPVFVYNAKDINIMRKNKFLNKYKSIRGFSKKYKSIRG